MALWRCLNCHRRLGMLTDRRRIALDSRRVVVEELPTGRRVWCCCGGSRMLGGRFTITAYRWRGESDT